METALIAVDRDPEYAPCSFLICRVSNPADSPQLYDWDTRDDENTVLVQTDWDHPGVASAFGFTPCDCGETDGTVDCAHKSASDMMEAARGYLHDCVDDGRVVVDPGYFG